MSRAAALSLATAKRWSSSSDLLTNHKSHGRELSHKMRALLRETAQPVAVVTSFMPMPKEHAPQPTSSSAQPSSLRSPPPPTGSVMTTGTTSPFHGATLSSFTSISMAPHHLVAFSLRVPSRMAASLADLSSAAQQPSSSAHMVINLLAAPQTHAAILFSRPDLHPRPFEDPGIQWSLSRDGLPVLHGCLGALSCRVVGAPWPLNNLTVLGDKPSSKVEGTRDGGDIESELFIAEVLRVEDVPQAVDVRDDDTIRTLPLVYHRRRYTTTTDQLPLNQKTNS